MKKIMWKRWAVVLAVVLMLTACKPSGTPETTVEPTAVPTLPPTAAPTTSGPGQEDPVAPPTAGDLKKWEYVKQPHYLNFQYGL
jgi:hypothetical protein